MERSSGVFQGGRDEGILDFDRCRVLTLCWDRGGHTDGLSDQAKEAQETNITDNFY